jgi:cell division protein FtsI/penicillin-binding protein 2
MNQLKARLLLVCTILGLGGAAVVIRLFTIQVLDNKRYSERSRDQTQSRHLLSAQRGTIYDRNGRTLSMTMDSRIVIKSENKVRREKNVIYNL